MTMPLKRALVVAHPDDENLWFSSVMLNVDTIIICFLDAEYGPAMTAGRRRALEQYPLKTMHCLDIAQSGVFNGANWDNPVETADGLAVAASEYTYPSLSISRYQENSKQLIERLSEQLAGCDVVYSHSPWGEYGHEEHVQVYRAIKVVQRRISFKLWVPSYVSNRSYPLMRRYVTGGNLVCEKFQTNKEIAGALKTLYQQNKCWTWFDDYLWPDEEWYFDDSAFGAVDVEKRFGQCVPLNFIELDRPKKRPVSKVGIRARIRRKIARWRGGGS